MQKVTFVILEQDEEYLGSKTRVGIKVKLSTFGMNTFKQSTNQVIEVSYRCPCTHFVFVSEWKFYVAAVILLHSRQLSGQICTIGKLRFSFSTCVRV